MSTKKTNVIHQPASGELYVKPSIAVKDQKLPAVNMFTYITQWEEMASDWARWRATLWHQLSRGEDKIWTLAEVNTSKELPCLRHLSFKLKLSHLHKD